MLYEIPKSMKMYVITSYSIHYTKLYELKDRVFCVFEKLGNIDSCLSEAISGWKLNRMSRMDLTILRLAVYEIFYDDSIPVKVSINEAVELAKKYGGESSPSFVNGVLAKVIKSNE